MATFTLTLSDRQTIYRLSTMIQDQYPDDETRSWTQWWTHVSVQAHPDNISNLKYGDKELSGLRYGRILEPGAERVWEGGGKGLSVNTDDKYFLCEESDNQQLLVELY